MPAHGRLQLRSLCFTLCVFPIHFTSAKDVGVTFYGPFRLSDEIANAITLMALRSWNLLTPQDRIVLYADNTNACDWLSSNGMGGVRCMVTCRHQELAGLNVSCILSTTASLADTDVLCLINSDVLLLPDFASVVRHLYADVQLANTLVVGQRTDLQVQDVDFSSATWAEDLAESAELQGELHAAWGLDYFVHKRRLWNRFHIPPFLVGSWRWDNVMLAEAVLDTNVTVIDATPRVHAVHMQKVGAGTLPKHRDRKFSQYNDMLAQAYSKKQYMLGAILG